MAFEHPSAGTSAILSAILFFLTLSGLQIFAPVLASTPQFTIVGGFVSSLLFFFGLLTVGNLERETGWTEVIICLFIALAAASTVHRVCVTTCFLFSGAILFYVNFMSRKLLRAEVSTGRRK